MPSESPDQKAVANTGSFPAAIDRFGHGLIYVLGSGKLWPLFAILFGTGFAIQLERAEARGVTILPTYLRRLFFMVVIVGVLGLMINVFQLLLLARAGLVMLFIGYALRRRPAKWLFVIAILALTLNVSVRTVRDSRSDSGQPGTPEASAGELAVRVEEIRADYESHIPNPSCRSGPTRIMWDICCWACSCGRLVC